MRAVRFILGGVLRFLLASALFGLVLVIYGASPGEIAAHWISHGIVITEGFRLAVLVFGLVILAFVCYAALYPALPQPSGSPVPQKSTRFAIEYLLNDSKWSIEHPGEMAALDAIKEVENAARSGQLTIWGREETSPKYMRIDAHFWETSGLDAIPHLEEDQITKTGPKASVFALMHGVPVYEDLRVDEAQIKRIWPRKWAVVGRDIVHRLLPKHCT